MPRGFGVLLFGIMSFPALGTVHAQDKWPSHNRKTTKLGTVPEGASLNGMDPVYGYGHSIAFVVKLGKHQHVVFGSKTGEAFDRVGRLTLSNDGKHLAYAAIREKENEIFLVLDGKRKGPFKGNVSPFWIRNAERWGYFRWEGADPDHRQQFLVIGKREFGPFEWIDYVREIPNTKQIGFLVRKGNEFWWKVVNLE